MMLLVKYVIRRFRKTSQFVLFSCFSLFVTLGAENPVKGQKPSLSATLDTNRILIGNQFTLFLEGSLPNNIQALWPVVPDTFSLMEVIKRSAIDTSKGDNNNITLRQQLVLTSFDSGYHVIPPFTLTYKNKGDTSLLSAESKALLMTVQGVAVDTSLAIRDIKDQVRIPFAWQEALPYVFGAIVLMVLLYFGIKWLRSRKRTGHVPIVKIPSRPAHEIALEQLRNLDNSGMWQKGNFKGYHSSLSDILRTFIENRYGVNAMEMTTGEIMDLNLITTMPDEQVSLLRTTLELSDLVKFAKMIPVAYENEQCMKNAITFVSANAEKTRETEVPA